MKASKMFIVILCFFLLLSLTNVSALIYRADVDTGQWSQYNSGLTSGNYQPATTGQTTYNRNFETETFSFNNSTVQCSANWCSSGLGATDTISASTDFAQDGTFSLKYILNSTAGVFYGRYENAGDSNVSFWTKRATLPDNSTWSAGYVDDANNFTSVITFVGSATFTRYTYYVPAGKYRVAFAPTGTSNANTVYFDNVQVLRNNTGTFRTTDPQYCGSINSCSNIENHLPANQLGTLYWIADFVAGASCTWSKNGVGQGAMTEGTNGMYYVNVNTAVDTNDWKDLNLSATCSKIPYNDKSFFTSARIYRYGNVDGGNFESETVSLGGAGVTCSTNWCSKALVTSAVNTTAYTHDGQSSLIWDNTSASAGVLYSRTQYTGGSIISFYFRKIAGVADNSTFTAGYVNDANAYTAVLTFIGSNSAWTYLTYSIPAGSYRVAFAPSGTSNNNKLYFDNISSSAVKQTSTMTASNTLTTNFGLKGTSYSFYSSYVTGAGASISDANCFLVVDGTYNAMTYDGGNSRYYYSQAFATDTTYLIKHTCGSVSYNDGNTSYTITITTPASQIISFTPIQNIGSYNLSNLSPVIDISPANNTDDIIFSVINQENAYNLTFQWVNTENTSSKQYSIYTSSDGVNWVFNDTLTFGSSSSYNDPVQKIPLLNGYRYSFNVTLPNAIKTYYKLVLNTLPLAYEQISTSADWVNVNQPTIYTDTNNKKWDAFADSNYTPMRSYTSKRFPDLTTADLNSGFEIQFTAYSTTYTTLKVGYTLSGTDYTVNVPVTPTVKRFSVPVDPTSNEARLLIKSDGNNNQVYLANYAVVPKAYFTGRLELLNSDHSPLNSILVSGTSNVYIREAVPFIIQTSAYDKDADLQRLNVQAMIGTVIIKTQDFLLKDATKKDKVFTWDELIQGFVDYDGNAVSPSTLRNVFIKATLYNTAGQSVSEQSATVKILQYPYFQSDITFDIYSLAGKVGENPSVRLNLNQKDPTQLIGTTIYIYDKNHSIASPNYSETVLNDALGCTTFICSKDLIVTNYVYEQATQYKIGVQLLLKTEYDSVQNPLTFKIFNQQVTYRAYDTARILQVFERTDLNYRNDERIQLVLQLRDVPYKDLSGDTTVYITVDTCQNETGDPCLVGTTKFYPKKFIYDQTTGYNYFFFDQLFYTDAGNLLFDGNFVRFQATIVDKYNAHNLADVPTATLANKCQSASYGTLFNNGWFNMNFWDSLISATQRALYGCGTLTGPIVVTGDAQEARLFIDADHNVVGGQNQSIACVKPDNTNFQNTLEQDLICGVLWNKNEQAIDKFVFTIGNENSDYSKTKDSAQYMTFEIPAEQLIFSDSFMLQQGLNAEYSTDSIDTVGEVFFYGIDKLYSGVANSLTEIPEGLTKAGVITNFGFDVNWSNQLNPNYVKGIFFFKVKGLKVINQYDYIDQYPELEQTNPKYFREFANQKKIKLPIDKTLVNFYTNNLANWSVVGAQIDSMEVISPLVIYAKPSYVQTAVDANETLVATILKFDLISDMLSNNQTTVQRLYLPLTFSYVVPTATGLGGLLNDILYGKDSSGNPAGIFTNPVGFGFKNWFWFLLGIIGILILSLVVRNFRTGGGGEFNLPVVTPFLDGRNKYRKGR